VRRRVSDGDVTSFRARELFEESFEFFARDDLAIFGTNGNAA